MEREKLRKVRECMKGEKSTEGSFFRERMRKGRRRRRERTSRRSMERERLRKAWYKKGVNR